MKESSTFTEKLTEVDLVSTYENSPIYKFVVYLSIIIRSFIDKAVEVSVRLVIVHTSKSRRWCSDLNQSKTFKFICMI